MVDSFVSLEIPDLVDLIGLKTKILQNTRIVIHGDCFLRYLLNDMDLKWAGAYQAFVLRMTKIFSSLKQLNVEPIFVFEGCMDKQVVETSITIPVCLKSAIIDLMVALGIKHITAFMSARISAVSLATFLQCPLLASGADYIFMVSHRMRTSTNPDLIYIPLELLDSESSLFGCDPNHIDLAIPCVKVVYPNTSKLRPVADMYRPLLALFFAHNHQIRIEIPPEISPDHGNSQSRLDHLIRWLACFEPDSNDPFDQIFHANLDKNPSTILQHAMLSFVYDPQMDGRLLALKLQLNEPNTPLPDSDFLNTSDLGPHSPTSQAKHSGVDLGHLMTMSDDQTNHAIMKFHWKPDFIMGWPLALIHAYQFAKFHHSLLLPLYFHGGLQLPPVLQDSAIALSVYQFSLPVRAIAYEMLVSFETQSGRQAKLRGLNPDVIEYEWRDRDLFKRTIELQPLQLDLSTQNADQILNTYLGLPFIEQIPQPDWLLSLAFTVALWFQQYSQFVNPSEINFDDSTLGLTMCACAVANINNLDFMDDNLSDHYDRLINFIEQETTRFIERTSADHPTDPEVDRTNSRMHHFNALQSIYLNLRSVVNILNSLLPSDKQSTAFSFLPPWLLFPSGRLFNCFAAHLEKQLPSIRFHQVIHFWLPRLYGAKHKNSLFSPRLKHLTDIFRRLVRIVSILCRSTLSCISVKHTLAQVESMGDATCAPNRRDQDDYVTTPRSNGHSPTDDRSKLDSCCTTPWVRGQMSGSATKQQPPAVAVAAKRCPLRDFSNKSLF